MALTRATGLGTDINLTGNLTTESLQTSVVKVGTAVTISAGIISATSYEGSGASLDGIDATSLKDSQGNTKLQANESGLVITGIATGNLSGTASTSTSVADSSGNVRISSNDSGMIISGIATVQTGKLMVGNAYIDRTAVGIGSTTTAGRDAGIGTMVGSMIYNSDTNSVQVYKPTTGWQAIDNTGDAYPLGMTATGGFMNEYLDPGPGKYYRSHTFNSTGTFQVTALGTPDMPTAVDYLVVGGGGGAGVVQASTYDAATGGGGAGGFVTGSFTAAVESKAVTIGAGGIVQQAGSSATLPGSGGDGGESYIGPSGAKIGPASGGGGGGKAAAPGQPSTGGNSSTASGGGGSSVANVATAGGAGGPQGNTGGTGGTYGGGGGGGAGGIGGNATSDRGGVGGSGSPNTFAYGAGDAVIYAGGGGGGDRTPGGSPNPGPGGGGSGGTGASKSGKDGTYATGGGGGGVFGDPSSYTENSGRGGSGTVVMRYEIGQIQVSTAKATGGNIAFRNGQTIHTFASSGTFAITDGSLTSVKCLVVGGGGGGGGGYQAGAGGAGLLHYRTAFPVSNASPYAVTVGAGGIGGDGGPAPGAVVAGTQGGDSVFSTLTATGGGYGNSFWPAPGQNLGGPGGSAGGTGCNPGNGSARTGDGDSGHPGGVDVVSPANGWGNDGGASGPYAQPYSGGGGGGAATVGGDGGGSGAGASDGGDGARYTILDASTEIYYAAGGGGGGYGPGAGDGGLGGGGDGGIYQTAPLRDTTDGVTNTGSGGGGGGGDIAQAHPIGNVMGGAGGSGIVIISYPT